MRVHGDGADSACEMLFLLAGMSGRMRPMHLTNDCQGIQFDSNNGPDAQDAVARADSDTDSLLLGIEM